MSSLEDTKTSPSNMPTLKRRRTETHHSSLEIDDTRPLWRRRKITRTIVIEEFSDESETSGPEINEYQQCINLEKSAVKREKVATPGPSEHESETSSSETYKHELNSPERRAIETEEVVTPGPSQPGRSTFGARRRRISDSSFSTEETHSPRKRRQQPPRGVIAAQSSETETSKEVPISARLFRQTFAIGAELEPYGNQNIPEWEMVEKGLLGKLTQRESIEDGEKGKPGSESCSLGKPAVTPTTFSPPPLTSSMGRHLRNISSIALEQDEDAGKKQQDQEKTVLYKRHRLQKVMLSKETPPEAADMDEVDGHFMYLERHKDLEAKIIKNTKIHLVMRDIGRLSPVPPKDAQYNFVKRSTTLLDIWTKTLSAAKETHDTGKSS